MENKMTVEKNGEISVAKLFSREEMIKNFYTTKENIENLQKQMLEVQEAMEQGKAQLVAMEEQRKYLLWFLKESGPILDSGKKVAGEAKK